MTRLLDGLMLRRLSRSSTPSSNPSASNTLEKVTSPMRDMLCTLPLKDLASLSIRRQKSHFHSPGEPVEKWPTSSASIFTPFHEHGCLSPVNCYACQAYQLSFCRPASSRSSAYNVAASDWDLICAGLHLLHAHVPDEIPSGFEWSISVDRVRGKMKRLGDAMDRAKRARAWTWEDPMALLEWATGVSEEELRKAVVKNVKAPSAERCDACLKIWVVQRAVEGGEMWRRSDIEAGWYKPHRRVATEA